MAPHAPAGHPISRAPLALFVALLVTVAYAVFAHGATDTPAETRVQLALAICALPVVAVLAGGRSSLRADGTLVARAGVLLLLAFAAWCGLSMLWSVAPDRTWMEVNRAVAYALIAGLGLVVGASLPRALERVALAWLLLATVVALYAFGSKTIPGVHLLGVDFDQTGMIARLRAPLDYWNALGLLLAMAVPVALRISVDRTRGSRARTGAVLVALLLVLDLGMTYSRGAVLAVAVTLVVMTVLGRDKLRTLVAAAVVGVAAAGPLALAFTERGLSDSGVDLGTRISDGRHLLALTVVVALVLIAVVQVLLRHEDRVVWSAARTRTLGKAGVVLAAAALLVLVIAATVGTRGLPGNVHQAWRDFTVPTADAQLDPSRLATTTSGNRWVWWNEAAGAFSDRPFGGWGAGSFRSTHLWYRTNTIAVTQPHSVPLQFLAETGLVGFLLAYAGIGALLWAGVARLRALPHGRERELGGALLAATVAWLVHGLYDWDWDIPGVSLPPLLFLGVLAGGATVARRRGPGAPDPYATPVVMFVDPERETRLRAGALLGVAAATIALFAYATSAILPAWSASKSDAAQEAIGGEQATDDQLRHAAAEADLAARLDPVSIEPLLVSATIAQRRGRFLEARDDLLEAVHRQPDNFRAWNQLGTLALPLADRQGFVDTTARALALDPHNPLLRTLAARAVSFLTPAGESATATGTPLPGSATAAAGTPPAPGAVTGTGVPDPAAPIAGAPGTDPGTGALPGTTATTPGVTTPGATVPPATATTTPPVTGTTPGTPPATP